VYAPVWESKKPSRGRGRSGERRVGSSGERGRIRILVRVLWWRVMVRCVQLRLMRESAEREGAEKQVVERVRWRVWKMVVW